jgi:hypothetical protein
MKSIVEHQCYATHPEKAGEPAHETESTSLSGAALSDCLAEHSVRAPDPGRREPATNPSRCYEHRQAVVQTERGSEAPYTRPVCERGG